MTPEYLIDLMDRRLAVLNNNRASAESNGDLDTILAIDHEIANTKATLDKLKANSAS